MDWKRSKENIYIEKSDLFYNSKISLQINSSLLK